MARNIPFLKLIKQLESSGGKNVNHRKMQSGVHEGDTAIGHYGLMPKTVQEIVKRSSNKSDLDNMILNAQSHQVKGILDENPHKYEQYAEQLSDKLLDKTKGDPALAATGWLYGHNMSTERMKQKLEKDKDYNRRIEDTIKQEALYSPVPEKEEFIDTLVEEPKPQDVRFSRIKRKLTAGQP